MSAREVPAVKKYIVRLSAEERLQLDALIRKGKSSAQRLMKARILLKADVSDGGEGWSDSRIVEALETSLTTIYRTRQQLVEEGLEAVLSRKKPSRTSVLPIFDGEKEARLIALACSKPPEGHARWSLRLLENKVVELGIVEHASDSTIGRVLKNSTQAAPQNPMGHPAQGKRCVRSRHGGRAVRLHAAAPPGAKKIVLVQDNLNTHAPASLYEAFPPPEARRLVERFEWHYTRQLV
jgi:Homeodomain-like domain